jgi:hypothetical protein
MGIIVVNIYTAFLRSPSKPLVTFERLGILKFCFLPEIGKGPWQI